MATGKGKGQKPTKEETQQKTQEAAKAKEAMDFKLLCIAFREEIEARKAAYERKRKAGKLKPEDKVKEVIARIGDEGMSLLQACKGVMVRSYFYELIEGDSKLADSYARAQEDREELYFDLIESVAFNRSEDHTPFTGVNVIQRDKLITDVLKWKLARMNGKKYGDKLDIDHEIKERVKVVLDLSGDDDEDEDK